ncbi:MAG: DNA polymerase III subunit gamma/tau [Anaerolineae bacterium]|nr:DNA polymerase III subunit gamma/tau [Anaerolineae bacterium]
MAQALYRRWRPQTFDDVVGQEHIVQTLRHALRTEHIHHAYLLAGPRGTGKTTTARLIAKAVNCLAPLDERPCNRCEICQAVNDGRLMDLVEIDAASNTGVDNIRDLLEKVGYRPAQATYKVYVVDEVHMLSTAAFNALLKTLEEPPPHVIFVLATTEVHKIPETILSRCQRFEFRRIPLGALVDRLGVIATAEGVATEPEALELIARAATGSMRDAISLLDQLSGGDSITADYVRLMLGAERREVVRSLLAAWVDRDLSEGLGVINRAIDGGADPRQLARQAADALRGLLLIRLGAGQTWTDPTTEERPLFDEMALKADPDRLVAAVRCFSDVAARQRTGWQPQLPLELAFVEAALKPAALQPGQASQSPTSQSPAATKPAQVSAPSPPSKMTRLDAAHAAMPDTVPALRPAGDSPASKRLAQSPITTAAGADTNADSRPNKVREAPAIPPLEVEPVGDPASVPGDGALAADSGMVDTAKANWLEIVKQVQPVHLGALLRDASVGGVDQDGHLVLLFQHAFHCERVAQEANARKVEDYLSQTFGQKVRLRCVMAQEWQAPKTKPRGTTKPAAIPIEEDELVRRAQQELGAVPRRND